jgi:predicted ArsR family transcriptional regulator
VDKKFFESSRGKIVLELRSGAKTVNELAAALGLTDNAIRASLLTLERDRLVEQSGSVKGFRKPHYAYRLTSEARKLFPRSYDSLFNVLVTELKQRLSPASVIAALRSAGQRIGGQQDLAGRSLDERIDQTVAKLEELGGAPRVIRDGERVVIKSESCPFAESVSEHPEVCQVAEAMLEEMLAEPVTEVCERNGTQKCCFEIKPSHSV